VQINVEVPGFSVIPVLVKLGVVNPDPPEPEEILDVPRLSVLVRAPLDTNCPQTMLKLLVLNVPCKTDSATVTDGPTVRLLPNVQPPPAPLKVTVPVSVVPFVVTVLPVDVELNVVAPVELHTVPASNDMEPAMFSVGLVPVANVTTPAETVISRQFRAPVMVT
jgi:hypothetical protein